MTVVVPSLDDRDAGLGGVMRKELFGVFGNRETFRRFRSEDEFDLVLTGETVTVGVRDESTGLPGRTTIADDGEGLAVVWGEAFTPGENTAAWLRTHFESTGRDALAGINGSHVAVIDHGGDALVAVDPLRSRDCFYTDRDGVRCFGTDFGALARLHLRPRIDTTALLEFLHLSFVTGDGTLFEGVRRVPFDGYVTPEDTGEFDRFVYSPGSFDYAQELTDRLRRALDRRSDYPGRKGLLLSAGQDSRSFLAAIDIDHCYTVGRSGSQQVKVARRLADQYGATHTILEPDARYLVADGQKVRYTSGIRESIHAHQAGYDDRLNADVMYHGLLYDTLFKGFFLDRAGVNLFGQRLRLMRPEPDVDPVSSLLDTLGYLPAGSEYLAENVEAVFGDAYTTKALAGLAGHDPRQFLEQRIAAELDRLDHRTASVHDTIDAFAIKHQPALSFRTHLADNYLESFVAADAELVDWHLRTPPRYRHPNTVHTALANLDPDIFRHRPPARPRRSELLNQFDRFARRTLPFFEPLEPAWPDYAQIYNAYNLDDALFPETPAVRALPVRCKLRIRDARWWLSECRIRQEH